MPKSDAERTRRPIEPEPPQDVGPDQDLGGVAEHTPIRLVGPPGTGRTTLATAVGEVFAMPTEWVQLASRTAVDLGGLEGVWRPFSLGGLADALAKNPAARLVLLDEIDGTA